MCLGMFLLGLILYETLHFLDLGDWFLSPVKKFSAIISSDIFSGPVSSPSGIPIMGMLMCHMLPQRSLKTILIFSFFFSVLRQWFPPLFLPAPWSILPHLFCYRFLLVYFPFQLLYSTTLSGWSLYFLTLLKTFCNFSHPSFPEVVDYLYSHYSQLFLGQTASFLHSLSWCLGVLSCSFVWNILFSTSFCLNLFEFLCTW